MPQKGAIFTKGARYIRMKDTGNVYPYHEEAMRLVKRDLADLVESEGGIEFKVIRGTQPESEKPVSRPAPRPSVTKIERNLDLGIGE